MIQCGPVVGVRLSCLQRTLASLLKAREMGVYLASLGPWLMQWAWDPLPACRARNLGLSPFTSPLYRAHTLCRSVRSRSWGASLVAPAHARVATEGTRDGRVLGFAWAVAHSTGLGPTACLPNSGLTADNTYQRIILRARSLWSSAVP